MSEPKVHPPAVSTTSPLVTRHSSPVTESPAEAILFESYTLAIVRLKSAALKAQQSRDREMESACANEIQRLELRRNELLEQMENRVGGS